MCKKTKKIKKQFAAFKRHVISMLNKTLKEVELLDSATVKQILNISDSTLYRMRKNKDIPFRKVGKLYYYPKSFFTKEIENKFNP